MVPISLPEKDTDAILEAVWKVYWLIADDEASFESSKLRASSLGGPCERALWYTFHWADKPVPFEPRITRLFATGKREESRVIDDLRKAGITVHDMTDDGEQYTIEFAQGHGKGSIDGVCENLPRGPDPVSGEPRFYKSPHLLEIKTHSLKSFEELRAKGMRLSKPQHYTQMQLYMHGLGLDRGLYWATCKDNDTIYLERVRLDHTEVDRANARANRIVFENRIPDRIFDSPDDKMAWICRQCSHLDICHYKAMPQRRNCRTCLNATPADGGVWRCDRWAIDLDQETQEEGCPAHLYLPTLIPGEQLDAGTDSEEHIVWTSYSINGIKHVDTITRTPGDPGLES